MKFPLKKIFKVLIILSIVYSLTLKTTKAASPFEITERFDYPDGSSPAPGWYQINAECKDNIGCYQVNSILNNDGSSANWTVKDGKYQLIISPHKTLSFVRALPNNWPSWLQNYAVDFDIHLIDSVNYDRNFVIRYQDPNHYYDLHIYGTSVFLDKTEFDTSQNKNNGRNLGKISNYQFTANTTYHFKVKIQGNNFKVYINNMNKPLLDTNDIPSQNLADPYLTGPSGPQSGSWMNSRGDVWFDNILITPLEGNITPTPIPTVTPLPTSTPTSTPILTTKVILAPGMGASWNTEAILGCKLSGYKGEWTMAPFAQGVYQPLIQTLKDNGFEVYPFFYDWRQNIKSHDSELGNLITKANLKNGEKISFVGHSMGGLVGRAYLEDSPDQDKIDKYLSAGTPHQGDTLAYPAWFGGEVWNNSLVTKIAETLLLKHCGRPFKNDVQTVRNIIPAVKDMLPTYPFLKNKDGNLTGINTNNWLLNSSFRANINIKLATLTGQGFETIENIKVKEPTAKEKRLGLWEFGKPAGKETTTEGDGTVLLKSSQLDSVENLQLNQNHGGLVSSQEGQNAIINFLKGMPMAPTQTLRQAPQTPTAPEPKSALIIIASPASILSFDPQGKTKTGQDNMITYFDPQPGKYKLGILPRKEETTLLIGQFLENGDYSWKEYKIRGRLPLIKIIKFNRQKLEEEPCR